VITLIVARRWGAWILPRRVGRMNTGGYRVHHIGVTVRDLDRSLRWYYEVLGLKPRAIQDCEGPDLSRTVQLDEASVRVAFLDVGNTALALLEYRHPVGIDFRLRNCDVGAIHICIEVQDIDAEYERLKALGVQCATEPIPLRGEFGGSRFCYFRDPDGIQLELWEGARVCGAAVAERSAAPVTSPSSACSRS
jgi:catechol 2,3-dioxygenase-like lactoylglutathione lyase family enzyme